MPAFKKDPPTDPTIFDRLGITRDTIPEWLAQYTSDVIPDRTQTEAIAGPPPGDPDAGILGNAWRLARHVVPSLPYAAADVVNAGERLLNRPVVSQDPVAVGDALMVAGAAPLGGVAARAATGAAIPDNAVTPRQASGYSFRPTDAKMLDAGVARDLKRASVREGIANQSPRDVFTALRNYSDDMKSAGEGLDGYSLYKDGNDTGLGVFGARDGERFDVEWVGRRDGTGNAANRLGPRELRSAMRAFRDQVPGVQVVEGLRSSGAGPGRMQRVRSEMFANPDDVTTGTVLDAVGRAPNLPMDKASRMARAKELGFDTENVYYHGTTHPFMEFADNARGNIEGHYGAGHYFTSSPVDASKNYAGRGPDLSKRIDMRAERLADEVQFDRDVSPEVAERYAKWRARKELVGPSDGHVLPVYLRGTTVDVRNHTRGRPTAFELEQKYSADDFMDDARKELGDGADKWDLYDRAMELADEANAYEEPTGPLWSFMQSIRRDADTYGFDGDEALTPIMDDIYAGLSASDLDAKLRNGPLLYAEDPDTGSPASSDILRRAFQAAGYDNILMDAKSAFPSMPNIPEGTTHIITSNPRNIRSVNAAFDPAKKDSANLLAANPNDVTTGTLMDAIARQRAATELDRRLQEDGPERWS
jgi:hypothetical protein